MALYRLEDIPDMTAPVVVAAIEGWVDAGVAGTTAAAQLAARSATTAFEHNAEVLTNHATELGALDGRVTGQTYSFPRP